MTPRRLPPRPFLYPIVDVEALGGRPVGPAVAALALGGARLIQLRAKRVPDTRLVALACEAVEAARAAGVLLLIDDRPDVARIVGADGVHVGQDDLPAADARAVVGPDALVGFSTHNLGQLAAAEAEPVDYVAIGPVFPTRTKEDPDPVVGLDLVRRARALTRRPLVGIGGMRAENAADVVAAGADGVASISALLAEEDLAAAARRFEAVLRTMR